MYITWKDMALESEDLAPAWTVTPAVGIELVISSLWLPFWGVWNKWTMPDYFLSSLQFFITHTGLLFAPAAWPASSLIILALQLNSLALLSHLLCLCQFLGVWCPTLHVFLWTCCTQFSSCSATFPVNHSLASSRLGAHSSLHPVYWLCTWIIHRLQGLKQVCLPQKAIMPLMQESHLCQSGASFREQNPLKPVQARKDLLQIW